MCRIFFLVLLFVVMTGITYANAGEPRLTIITEDWPPYNYAENGEVKGFSTEIVQALLDKLNLDYEIRILPGARGEKLLAEGTQVMSFSLFRTSEREKLYKWIGPIAEDAVYFYKKKGSTIKINTLDDAKKVGRVACRHRGLVYSVLKREGFNNLELTPNPNGIIQKLVTGRADLSVSEPALGVKFWLRQAKYPIDALEKTPVKLVEFPLYIACSKDIPDDVIQKWQMALEAIKVSELYNNIYSRYLK